MRRLVGETGYGLGCGIGRGMLSTSNARKTMQRCRVLYRDHLAKITQSLEATERGRRPHQNRRRYRPLTSSLGNQMSQDPTSLERFFFAWVDRVLPSTVPAHTAAYHFNLYEGVSSVHVQLTGTDSFQPGEVPERDYWRASPRSAPKRTCSRFPSLAQVQIGSSGLRNARI